MSGTSGTKDPRIPGNGLVSYDVLQQELTLSFGGLYRFDVGSKHVMPYGGIGGRMYLLDTKVKGSVGGQAYPFGLSASTLLQPSAWLLTP